LENYTRKLCICIQVADTVCGPFYEFEQFNQNKFQGGNGGHHLPSSGDTDDQRSMAIWERQMKDIGGTQLPPNSVSSWYRLSGGAALGARTTTKSSGESTVLTVFGYSLFDCLFHLLF